MNVDFVVSRRLYDTVEPAATYIPTPVRCSIIGDEGLSFLVRNGAGRFPLSIATGNSEVNVFG